MLLLVFLRELEAYSYLEKQHLLSKLVELQEYIHQGIPVVTQFLFNYLLIWDGAEHLEEVLNLLTWVTNAPIQGNIFFFFTIFLLVFAIFFFRFRLAQFRLPTSASNFPDIRSLYESFNNTNDG